MTTPTGGAPMEKKSMNPSDEIKKIKNGGGEIKVCFITAFEASYNVFERLFPKLQIDCFIRKPISIDKLVEAVKTKPNYYNQ